MRQTNKVVFALAKVAAKYVTNSYIFIDAPTYIT
jgi:hypothetical protein